MGGIYNCYVFYDTATLTYRARVRGLDLDPSMTDMIFRVDIEWDVFIRMRITGGNTFYYTFSALVATGAPELSNNYLVTIPNYSSACSIGVYNGLPNELYIKNYRELAVREIFA